MLTKSQQKVFDYLKSRVQSGLPPTVREICEATGLHSTSSVHAHLKTLEREGYIVREAGHARPCGGRPAEPGVAAWGGLYSLSAAARRRQRLFRPERARRKHETCRHPERGYCDRPANLDG